MIATLALIVATAGGALLRAQQRASWDISGGQVATVGAAVEPAQLLYTNPERVLGLAHRLAPAGSRIDLTAGDDNSWEWCTAGGASAQVPISLTAGSGVVVRVVTSGRWFAPSDATAAVPAAVLDTSTANSLGDPQYVSCSFEPGRRTMTFRVIGEIDTGGVQTAFLDLADPRVRIPELLGRSVDVSAALRIHASRSEIPAITRAVRDTVNLLRMSPNPIDASFVTREDGGVAVDDLVGKVTVIMAAIATIMLAIAVLGILNIGFATVRERSEELTLRRALGASKAGVAGLMVIEAAIVGIGAVAAAIGGSVVLYLAFIDGLLPIALPPVLPAYPLAAAALGAAVALAAAMAAAVFPAIRATRVEPAEMMRA